MSSAATRIARLRKPAGSLFAVGAVTTGYLYWQQQNRQLQLDAAYKNDPVLKTPQLAWVPPTRDEMLSALRRSAMLPKKFEPTDDLAQARDVKIPQIGEGEEGYDLLVSATDRCSARSCDSDDTTLVFLYRSQIIGGGATGAGTAVDAASRGLKVAMVERDDWSSGA